MPDTELSFLPFVLVATTSAGGATTLVLVSGARFGFLHGVPLVTAIPTRLGVLAASAATGLASLLIAYPRPQTALKIAGTLCLLRRAWRIGRVGPPRADQDSVTAPVGYRTGIPLGDRARKPGEAGGAMTDFSGCGNRIGHLTGRPAVHVCCGSEPGSTTLGRTERILQAEKRRALVAAACPDQPPTPR